MKKIKMIVELEYNEDMMEKYGYAVNDEQDFYDGVLLGNSRLSLHSNNICANVGKIKVIEILYDEINVQ